MSRKVKNTTRVSTKHQVTIPARAFGGAGFKAGDRVKVEAVGSGQVMLTRIDEILDRYSGALDSKGSFRAGIEQLREEWQ